MIKRCLTGALLLPILSGMLTGEQKSKSLHCMSVSVVFSLKAGESYQQEIGNLTFDMHANTPIGKPNGWNLSIYGESGDDYIAPVSIPLRFNPSQILGPGYGLSASQSLQTPRQLLFLLNESDFQRILSLWHDALWPYSAPDPDRAADIYISTAAKLSLGLLKLKTLKADVSPEDVIRSATFEASFIVPSGFHLDPSLKPQPYSCPQPFK